MSATDNESQQHAGKIGYEIPNPLNTQVQREYDWLTILLAAQLVILGMIAVAYYTGSDILSIVSYSSKTGASKKSVNDYKQSIDARKVIADPMTTTLSDRPKVSNHAKATSHALNKVAAVASSDTNTLNQSSQTTKESKTVYEEVENTPPIKVQKLPEQTAKQRPLLAGKMKHQPLAKSSMDVRESVQDTTYSIQQAWFRRDLVQLKKVLQNVNAQEFSELLQFVAANLQKQDQWMNVSEFCRVAKKQMTNQQNVVISCSDHLMNEGEFKQAISLFDIKPKILDNIGYYTRLAYLQLQLNQFHAAIETYKNLLSIDQTQSSLWLGLGYALEKTADMRGSYQAYKYAYRYAEPTAEYLPYLEEVLSNGSHS